MRNLIGLLVGGAFGFFAWFIAMNLEDTQFYTVRKLITGKANPSEMVAHPADAWVFDALLFLFVFIASIIGLLVARYTKNMKTNI